MPRGWKDEPRAGRRVMSEIKKNPPECAISGPKKTQTFSGEGGSFGIQSWDKTISMKIKSNTTNKDLH